MTNKKITYTEAFSELNKILEKIEKGELDVDDLTAQVKKAAELIKICKGKLYDTEAEIEKILEDIEENESGEKFNS
jgi:exodeoxyribonuclease VII small subunit